MAFDFAEMSKSQALAVAEKSETKLAKLKQETMAAASTAIAITEVAGTAALIGFAGVRYAKVDKATGQRVAVNFGGAPLDLTAALVGLGFAFTNPNSSMAFHAMNVGTGALATYMFRMGAQAGQEARDKAEKKAGVATTTTTATPPATPPARTVEMPPGVPGGATPPVSWASLPVPPGWTVPGGATPAPPAGLPMPGGWGLPGGLPGGIPGGLPIPGGIPAPPSGWGLPGGVPSPPSGWGLPTFPGV